MESHENTQEQTKPLTPLEKIILDFRAQRDLYNNEIKSKVGLLRDIKTLIDANVHFLSLRQRILEDNHTIIESFDRLNRQYKETRSSEYRALTENNSFRYQSTEKDKVIDGLPKVAALKLHADLLNSQINFMKESIRTVDQILYAFKVRMDIHKILEGG